MPIALLARRGMVRQIYELPNTASDRRIMSRFTAVQMVRLGSVLAGQVR
jgi:hypothetical protein